MGGRQTAHTEVDGLACDGEGDTSVLRNAAFGDVEVRQDLDTRDDGRGHLHVRSLHFVKRAVDAVANLEVMFERLDVNIGRTVDDALVQDEVDEADDGGRVGGVLHRRDVVGVRGQGRIVIHTLAEGLDHVRDGVARITVVLRNAVHHVLLAGKDETDLLGQREEHLVRDARIDEIKRRKRHGRVVDRHREHVVHTRRGGGNGFRDLSLERHRAEVDRFGVLIGGHRAEEVVFAQDFLVDDEPTDGFRLGLREVLQVLGLLLVDVTVLDENLENRIYHGLVLAHLFLELLDDAVGVLGLGDELFVGNVTVLVVL